MALDEAAAEAAAEDAVATMLANKPPMPLGGGEFISDWEAYYAANAPEQRVALVEGYKTLFLQIFTALKTHAVVSPFGSSPSMNVGGTPVTGVGKLE